VLTLVLMSALGGCGGTGGTISADGPLSSGSGIHDPSPTGSVCAPGGRAWTFADQTFTNYGKVTVVLSRVVLLRPHDQRLIGSYVMPGLQQVGTVPWPPKYSGMPAEWKDRQPVRGYHVRPGKSFNTVLGIVVTIARHRAVSEGILVYYHDSSGSYVSRNFFGNIIAARPTCLTGK
jgi:hypothetical protein